MSTHDSSAIASATPEARHAETLYAAVGIPQGLVRDHASGEVAGAVRRGGELVSLARDDYELWTLLLTPMTTEAIVETALHHNWSRPAATLTRLEKLELLVTISPRKKIGSHLARLRPIPLGVGMGNLSGDSTSFQIQNATLSLPTPISVDPISIMFWWDFDGVTPLAMVVEHLTSRLPEFSADAIATAAASLTHLLMARRLLYLDTPRMTRE